MSYCKFGPDSDIYLYSSTHYPDNTPCWVLMVDSASESEILFSHQAAFDRLLTLRSAGKRIPDAALERLRGEMSNGAVIPSQETLDRSWHVPQTAVIKPDELEVHFSWAGSDFLSIALTDITALLAGQVVVIFRDFDDTVYLRLEGKK